MQATSPLEKRLLGQTLVGKYKLVEQLASGAFGVVFRAEQSFCKQFMRPVAVKISRQTGLTEQTAPALFGDALVLARLLASGEHEGRKHLVQIFDLGFLPEWEDRAYLVMEYVEGLPLLSHLRAAGQFSVATGLSFLEQICKAVALVHSQGAVHRDLKADNILVDRRGMVRVVDFGLAAFADPRRGFVSGAHGTYTYMAPETLFGRSTPASDIYSLGLLAYELFTGGGPHLSVAWKTEGEGDHRDDHYRLKKSLIFPPPSKYHNEIRNDYRWLDGFVLRCLETDPGRRFADASEMLHGLQIARGGGDLPAMPQQDPSLEIEAGSLARVPQPTAAKGDEGEELFREVRRLLASRGYDQVIDKLDIHRPAEWAIMTLHGARALRGLGQAYLGKGDLRSARECLEQLRTSQQEQNLLPRSDFVAALTDLFKCYRGLGQTELAQACQEEARRLLGQSE